MLKERVSFTQGFLRPMKASEGMASLRVEGKAEQISFGPTTPNLQKPVNPFMGLADTTNKSSDTDSVIGQLKSDDGTFKMVHTAEESVRKPIDESILRKVLAGRMAIHKRSMDSIAFGKKRLS